MPSRRDDGQADTGVPEDLMIGRCGTCGSVVEVPRRLASPPTGLDPLSRRHGSAFAAWEHLWSVECEVCAAKGVRVTSPDGAITQASGGPKVYLMPKGGA